MARIKHPLCPECGKAMYKSKTKGVATRKGDPFIYCRNDKCLSNSGGKITQAKIVDTVSVSGKVLRRRQKEKKIDEVAKEIQKKDEILDGIQQTIIETVVKKRSDIGFLCFIALVVKQLGFQQEYESIVDRCDLKGILGVRNE